MPWSTAALYYCVWAICLSAKISFGYYALISPLVTPLSLLNQADFTCWTPWSAGGGSVRRSSQRARVLGLPRHA